MSRMCWLRRRYVSLSFFVGCLMSKVLDSYLVQTTWCRLVVASENIEFVSYGI
jgi:hypothetical protein